MKGIINNESNKNPDNSDSLAAPAGTVGFGRQCTPTAHIAASLTPRGFSQINTGWQDRKALPAVFLFAGGSVLWVHSGVFFSLFVSHLREKCYICHIKKQICPLAFYCGKNELTIAGWRQPMLCTIAVHLKKVLAEISSKFSK